MDRRHLESAGEAYPYTHVQGLYAVPFGLVLWFFVGVANLTSTTSGRWVAAAGMVFAAAVLGGVSLYYQRIFGRVTPTDSRRTRYLVATVGGVAVFVVVDQIGRAIFGRPPERAISVTAAAWSVGMLVFYAVARAVKAHHLIIWLGLFVAALLPIWGESADRDAWAYFPIGAACMLSGLIDHRALVRTFRSFDGIRLEDGNVGA